MVKKTKRSSVAKMGKSIELERRHYYRKAVGLMTTGGECLENQSRHKLCYITMLIIV